MEKITLYAYKDGMNALLDLLHQPSQYSNREALNTLSLEEITLIEWRGRFTPQQLFGWQFKDNRKTYAVKLPISVAVALWKVLQRVALSPDLQELSDLLYRELINNGLKPNYSTYLLHD